MTSLLKFSQKIKILSLPLLPKYMTILRMIVIFQTLELGNVTPVHKKGEKTKKDNYRPISILPTISKVFERNMSHEIYT